MVVAFCRQAKGCILGYNGRELRRAYGKRAWPVVKDPSLLGLWSVSRGEDACRLDPSSKPSKGR
jgi:hypothetical protein